MGNIQADSLIGLSNSLILDQREKRANNYARNCPKAQSQLHKIEPILISDEEEPQPQEFQADEVRHQISVEQVRVKWNSFIKIRQGSFLHQYEVIKQLGRGGYGSVYKVKGKYNNSIRAAKKISKSELNAKQQQRLFNQVSILQSLDHPTIIKLYQVYQQADLYVLIMQLCEGGQLFKKIAKKQLTINQSAKIMRQLLEAITYIHSQNIVHRDIKPQNILFDKETGNIKLIDFGIAQRKKHPEDFLTSRIGTIYYLAPQVLMKRYKEKCDIWSAGVVLYMMIFGKPPFAGNNDYQIMDSILNDNIQFKGSSWTELPRYCKQLLVNMMQKNPDNRLSGRQILQNAWLSVQEATASKKHMLRSSAYNMARFGFKNRLEAVVYTYCISQLLNKSQKKGLESVFKKFDTNYDGAISLDEFKFIMNEHVKDQNRLKTIMRLIDLDGSGKIQFTEFLVAVLNPRQLLKVQHYEKAFDYFDIDHSGGISYEQIAKFLQGNQSANKIKDIFNQIDSNGDGNISRKQFVSLFLNKASKSIKQIGENCANQKGQPVAKNLATNKTKSQRKKGKSILRV